MYICLVKSWIIHQELKLKPEGFPGCTNSLKCFCLSQGMQKALSNTAQAGNDGEYMWLDIKNIFLNDLSYA